MAFEPLATFEKDPDAVLDYKINWAPFLPEGTTIETSVWTVDPTEGAPTIESDFAGDTETGIWLSGGTVGSAYKFTNHVTISGGPPTPEDDRTIVIVVKEK